jgi:hypothetical protein
MRIMSVSAAACVLIAVVSNIACGQISAPEGRWVVAHGADIASKCADYIKTEYKDSKEGSAFENAELVRIVTAAPEAWQFYSRDRGILIAIDAGPDVSLATRKSGPSKIARVAEAVIRQEREMAISDRVMVIFIDPAVQESTTQQSHYRPIYSSPIDSGSQSVWGYGTNPVGIAPSAGFSIGISSSQACDCR